MKSENFRSFFLFVLAFITSVLCSARDVYVAPGGSDKNQGTKQQPLATLEGARDLIRQLRVSGDLKETVNVLFANGIYYLSEPLLLDERDSGTESAPVIFKAEAGANPVFNGGIKISGWEKVSDKVWRAKVPEVTKYGFYFEQLYVNGQRAIRAKSPNDGFYFLEGVKETVVSKGNGRVPEMAVQKLKVPAAAATDLRRFSAGDFDDALLVLYHKWDNTRKRVAGFSADSQLVYTAGGGMKSWNSLDTKTRFEIENYKAALDVACEWYLDRSGELLYIPKPGEDPNTLQIFAPLTERFLVIQGKEGHKVQNIRFENLRFEVSAYQTPLWGNEPAQAASPVEAVIMVDFADHIDFVNCDISQTGTSAIWIRNGCSDCSVQHCYLHDLGAGGIKIGDIRIPQDENQVTKRVKADNNIIRSGGYVFPCAVGITLFQASDNQVTHNEIADFRYSGISVGWVWGYGNSPSKRNIIEFNHIHHLGWGELCDMGGVYCLGKSEGTSVSNNVIHHVYSFDYGGWGLYTDEGSTGIVMENNVVYACKNSGFHQHYGRENVIRNNIFAANIKGTLQATRIEEHLSFYFTNNIVWLNSGSLLTSRYSQVKLQSDHNAYWDTRTSDIRFDKLSFKEWQATGKDQNSVIADPGFANPDAFDFRVSNKKLTKKIAFKLFDYSLAGVYGDSEWMELAKSSPEMVKRYDDQVKALMIKFP